MWGIRGVCSWRGGGEGRRKRSRWAMEPDIPLHPGLCAVKSVFVPLPPSAAQSSREPRRRGHKEIKLSGKHKKPAEGLEVPRVQNWGPQPCWSLVAPGFKGRETLGGIRLLHGPKPSFPWGLEYLDKHLFYFVCFHFKLSAIRERMKLEFH